MTLPSDPHIIHADGPFNVEAVRSKSGRIDALAKRPRLSDAVADNATDSRSATVDPTRHILDTRARIAASPDADPPIGSNPAAPTDGDPGPGTTGALAAVAAPEPTHDPHPLNADAGTDPAGDAPARAATEAADDASALSELQQRMLDIKSSNQSLSRELQALEESLRPLPPTA